jgi:hypothetical protein
MKEPISVRVDPKTRATLERLADQHGRTISEELNLAVAAHIAGAQTTELALPAPLRNAHLVGTPLLAASAAHLDNRLVLDLPARLAPALPLFLDAWEHERYGAPGPDPPPMSAHWDPHGERSWQQHWDWYASWVDAHVRSAVLRSDFTLDQYRSLAAAGLLWWLPEYHERKLELARALFHDRVSRWARDELVMETAIGEPSYGGES